MTMETVLLSGISAVTAALVFVARILWSRSEQCERDREVMAAEQKEVMKEVGELKRGLGKLEGELIAYRNCRIAQCPFRAAVEGSLS